MKNTPLISVGTVVRNPLTPVGKRYRTLPHHRNQCGTAASQEFHAVVSLFSGREVTRLDFQWQEAFAGLKATVTNALSTPATARATALDERHEEVLPGNCNQMTGDGETVTLLLPEPGFRIAEEGWPKDSFQLIAANDELKALGAQR